VSASWRHDRRAATLPLVDDRERRIPDKADQRCARLNRRLRQAFIEGAEEDSRRRLGRGLTGEELVRVLRHYPGDVPERAEHGTSKGV
jgi:hypothetical protein